MGAIVARSPTLVQGGSAAATEVALVGHRLGGGAAGGPGQSFRS